MASFEASGEAGGTGLSKHIRALGISETYDLAGFGEAQVRVGVLVGCWLADWLACFEEEI